MSYESAMPLWFILADLDLKCPSLPLKLSDWLPEAASPRLSDEETIDYRRRRWRGGMSEKQKEKAAWADAQTIARLSSAVNKQFLRCLTMKQFSPNLDQMIYRSRVAFIFIYFLSNAPPKTMTSCPLWQSVFEICHNLHFPLRLW